MGRDYEVPEAVKDSLAGVASIFDFTDSANCDLDIMRSEWDDYAVMGNDWAMVGTDFWNAVDDQVRWRKW